MFFIQHISAVGLNRFSSLIEHQEFLQVCLQDVKTCVDGGVAKAMR